LARIIANHVNCATHNGCGKCESCVQFGGEFYSDLLEYDLGNDRGVDGIRALVKSSAFAPRYQYRVFILDEVHLATSVALGALIKSLEEPNHSTIFVLCTTDPSKLTPPILGRCWRLPLQPIPTELLVKRLAKIAKLEGFELRGSAAGAALTAIANNSCGQMRDAIQSLESMLLLLQRNGDSNLVEFFKHFATQITATDTEAVDLLVAAATAEYPTLVRVVRTSENAMGLLSKAKWLTQFLLDQTAGCAQFAPSFGRILEKKFAANKVTLPKLVFLTSALIETEIAAKSSSVDHGQLLLHNLFEFAEKHVVGK